MSDTYSSDDLVFPLHIAINENVFPLDIARLAQTLAECIIFLFFIVSLTPHFSPFTPHDYLMTLSALAITLGGIVSSRA